jgi:hypothetical protein
VSVAGPSVRLVVDATSPRHHPERDTLELIYDETAAQLDKQFEQIDALNARAQQLLGIAAGVFALVAGLQPPTRHAAVVVLFIIALAIFVAVIIAISFAWSLHGWRRDPDPEQLWARYRLWPEGWLRQQIILNRIASKNDNQTAINAKLFYLRAAQVLLGVEVSYLIVILIVRPYVT